MGGILERATVRGFFINKMAKRIKIQKSKAAQIPLTSRLGKEI